MTDAGCSARAELRNGNCHAAGAGRGVRIVGGMAPQAPRSMRQEGRRRLGRKKAALCSREAHRGAGPPRASRGPELPVRTWRSRGAEPRWNGAGRAAASGKPVQGRDPTWSRGRATLKEQKMEVLWAGQSSYSLFPCVALGEELEVGGWGKVLLICF